MARLAMLDPMNIKPHQIFPVNTGLSPEESARSYESDILEFFNGQAASFDLVMLGLGDDAHTASLFPGTDILKNTKDLVASVYLDDKKVYRISFTKKLINQAQCIAFLTFGEKKAPALAHVLGDEKNVDLYPAQLISPESGNLHWFVDQKAVSLISMS
jgi:6-phosphogluconolactonase